jgi:type IV pilus assembly protein PilV
MRGVTLIECLIALVVLAIGLMGLTSLMLHGLRTGHLALMRTQAVNLISDMQERIRANPRAGDAYVCSKYTRGPTYRGCSPADSAMPMDCTPSELAEDDLARWQTSARELLPLASDMCAADVAYQAPGTANEPAHFRVNLTWLERGEPEPVTHRSDLLLVAP